MYLTEIAHLKKLTSRRLIADAVKNRRSMITDMEDFLDYAEFKVKDILVRRYNESRTFDSEHHAINYIYMMVQNSVVKHYFSIPEHKGRERNSSWFSSKMAYIEDMKFLPYEEGGFTLDDKADYLSINNGGKHITTYTEEALSQKTKELIEKSTAPTYVKKRANRLLEGLPLGKAGKDAKTAAKILLRTKIKEATWKLDY